jgi:hypothetical protein
LPHASLRVPLPEVIPGDKARPAMAAADARHSRRADGSGVEPARGAHVSCAPMAATPGRVSTWQCR